MSEEYLEVLCPICGRGMGRKATARIRKGKSHIVTRAEDYIDFMLRVYDDKKPFGYIRQTGKAGFKEIKKIGIKEDPEKFKKFKRLFLKAIKSWLDKKWFSINDIKNLIE